tara:strand:+ start:334 stop:789 length:456 start_codon:yes stop_codon:yes gene_type:complete
MKDLFLVKHAPGAPGLRFLGLGPKFIPRQGMLKLQLLLDEHTSWAKKRNQKDIKKMLSHSKVIISVWSKDKLIGFGRATSDEIYRAVLWDIVVEQKHQKRGIGKIIVTELLSNRLITKAEKIYVMTTKFKKFYENLGFELEGTQKLMLLKK